MSPPGRAGRGGRGRGSPQPPQRQTRGAKQAQPGPATGSQRGTPPGEGSPGRGAGRPTGGRRGRGTRPAPVGDPRAGGRSRATPKGLGGTQVEGRHAVRELLLGDRRITEIWLASDLDPADIIDDIRELAAERRVLVREVSRGKLDAESRTEAAQGVLAHAAELRPTPLEALCEPADGAAPFLVALDGVTDPGNLGAIIRAAECAGVSGLVLPKHRAVHVTPSVTKAAAGAVEHVPMALVGGLASAISELRDRGVWVVGLDASGDVGLHDLELSGEPVCLVLGAEGVGLSRLVRQRCDVVVSIPLRGRLGSLNVATAAALACYEVVRRRSGPAGSGRVG